MIRYIIRRLLQTVLVLFLVMTLVFVILRVVGDPAKMMVTPDSSYEDLQNIRRILGLDQPIWKQYLNYLSDVLRGDFGSSYYFERPVIDLLKERLPATLKLGFISLAVSLPLALLFGVISAIKRNSLLDNAVTTFVVMGRSIPTFWFASLMVLIFSVQLKWLPASGYGETRQLIMPVIAMSSGMGASVTRLTRSAMLDVMRQDYITTARAKGAAETKVIIKHGLHNALLAVVTFVALQIGYMFAGSVVVESIFAIPGIGRLIVTAIKGYDFPLIQASTLIFALIFSIINCVADLCYLLEVENLKTYFPVYGGMFSTLRGYVHAVDDVSFTVNRGETLGLVGESGCGKSTLMQSVMRLIPFTSGRVIFDGCDLSTLRRNELQSIRSEFQIIYQDPFSSLNPRMTIGEIISEPLLVHGVKDAGERKQRTLETMKDVGLQEEFYSRYPHEFSGGQRQRVSITRSLILRPKLVLCDEPVSALDVSIQSQILNLLKQLRERYGLTYIFVSHALNVVRYLSDNIAVMYLGKIVEIGTTKQIFESAVHPYTRALISAIPVPDPTYQRSRILLKGDIASPKDPPKGCRFHTRCPEATSRCAEEEPKLIEYTQGHKCACFLSQLH